MTDHELTLADLERCFGGIVPGVLATSDATGMPNVAYITRAHRVDDERIAVSNQYMSKSARNLAEHPAASLLLVDPTTYAEFRLTLVFERTDRRGPVFQRLRDEIEAIAALTGMASVFRLRAATIFRVVDIVRIPQPAAIVATAAHGSDDRLRAVAELTAQIGRCVDLDTLVDTTLAGLARMLGFHHSVLLLVDESGRVLYTIGSHGNGTDTVGAEVAFGDGVIGLVAERCAPTRVGNLRQMAKYSRSVGREWADAGYAVPRREIPAPGLPGAESRIAVPLVARGELVGVLSVDSARADDFSATDQDALSVVAGALAGPLDQHTRAVEGDDGGDAAPPAAPGDGRAGGELLAVRYFAVDGSVFFDNEYLIKGVAGRILWVLLGQYAADGRTEFSNKELRLDPYLELPGFKDNLESRLILLKRRLDERVAAVRIERTGRGRFCLHVRAEVRLTAVEPAS